MMQLADILFCNFLLYRLYILYFSGNFFCFSLLYGDRCSSILYDVSCKMPYIGLQKVTFYRAFCRLLWCNRLCKTSLTLNNYILHFCHVSWGFSCMTKSVLLPSIFILFLCCTLDLNQKYGKNALFLKKYLQNICKFRTNPLPLHSLSLPNECASKSSLKD